MGATYSFFEGWISNKQPSFKNKNKIKTLGVDSIGKSDKSDRWSRGQKHEWA